jgi:transposase
VFVYLSAFGALLRKSKDGIVRKVYVVHLSGEERSQLEELVKRGKLEKGRRPSALKLTRSRILLKADQAEGSPAYTDAEIAEALDVSTKTVFNIRQKWVELGLEQTLERRQQKAPSRQPKLDGKAEAKLIACSCGPPPKGRSKWTLRLLSDKVVELGLAESISPETVRQTLKKTSSSLG